MSLDVYPLTELTPWSLGSAHMGESLMTDRDIRPGQPVKISVSSSSFICRAWLHSVAQVNYLEISSAVTLVTSDDEDSDDEIQLSRRGEKLIDIITLSESSADSVEVRVISLPTLVRRNLESVIRKLLLNIVLTSHCRVVFSESDQRCVGVHCVIVKSSHQVFTITDSTQVTIVDIVSKKRRDLIRNIRSKAVTLGGVDKLYSELKQSVTEHRNVLLSGGSGSGKSALVTRVLADLGLPALVSDSSSLARPEPGDTEHCLRDLWSQVESEGGGVLVLDNVDCVAGARTRGDRVTAQLNTLLDSCHTRGVVVIGLTTQPSALDPACRRPGRFETEINIKVPDAGQRSEMLRVLCGRGGVTLSTDLTQTCVERSSGYNAADLALLVTRLSHVVGEVSSESVDTELSLTRPAQLRSGLGSVRSETVTWDSLGGLASVKSQLIRAVQLPLTHPHSFTRLGVKPSKGVLLSGAPGTGKTRLVRAVASTCHVSFLSVSAAEIFSPFVGDSEKAIVEVFSKARQSAPALLFIDEIETLVAGRDYSGAQSSSDRVLAALLTEMDGLSGELGGGVVVVGATNRPGILDSALTRPGRLDTHISVPLPDQSDRVDILRTLLRHVPHHHLDTDHVSGLTEGYTGADLECVVREAVLSQLSDDMESQSLEQQYLVDTISRYSPSMSRSSQTLS